MSEHTCATRGHLWGALGKCVMCGDPRPMSEQSTLNIVRRRLADGRTISDGDVHALVQQIDHLRAGIQAMLAGNYPNPRSYRPAKCPHGAPYYHECPQCDEAWLSALLTPTPPTQDATHGAQAQRTGDDEGEATEPAGGDCGAVTRIEIIDQTGRRFVTHSADNVTLSFQDDGRTLKVFCERVGEWLEARRDV